MERVFNQFGDTAEIPSLEKLRKMLEAEGKDPSVAEELHKALLEMAKEDSRGWAWKRKKEKLGCEFRGVPCHNQDQSTKSGVMDGSTETIDLPTNMQPVDPIDALRDPKMLLQMFRKEAGFTQQNLAAFLGTSQSEISRVERGLRKMPNEWLEKIREFIVG